MKKIAIIGGGTAGIFTTLLLKDFKGEVHLFEQNNKIGKKLERTGGGRMNISNKVFSIDEFSSEQANLLKKLFKNPWITNRMDIFDELGVEYNWEENRAILKSQDATGEIERLFCLMRGQENLTIHLDSKIDDIELRDDKYTVRVQNNELFEFDIVVLSGGGMLRINDDIGKNEIYKLPIQLGHTITNLAPSLSSLTVGNNPLREFSGIAINTELSDKKNNKMSGDMLIAHHGLAGPLPLDFSSILEGSVAILNFIPEIKEEELTSEFNNLRQGKNSVRNYLGKFLPKRLSEWHLSLAGIEKNQFIADINKEKFKILKNNLLRFRLTDVNKLDYKFCWTTKGGVNINEINVATMESKIHKNLFFSGEILDINGLCGGYNISFAAISAKIVSEALCK